MRSVVDLGICFTGTGLRCWAKLLAWPPPRTPPQPSWACGHCLDVSKHPHGVRLWRQCPTASALNSLPQLSMFGLVFTIGSPER